MNIGRPFQAMSYQHQGGEKNCITLMLHQSIPQQTHLRLHAPAMACCFPQDAAR